MTSDREQLHVQNNLLDIIWSSKDLNQKLTPIRLPIFRGLLGYRVLVIRQNEQHKFDPVKTILKGWPIPLKFYRWCRYDVGRYTNTGQCRSSYSSNK